MNALTSQNDPHYVRLYPVFNDEEKGVSQAVTSSLQLVGRIQVNLENRADLATAIKKYENLSSSIAASNKGCLSIVPAIGSIIAAFITGHMWIMGIGGGVTLCCGCTWYGCETNKISKIGEIKLALCALGNSDSQFAGYLTDRLREKGTTQVSEGELIQFCREFRDIRRLTYV